MTCLLILNAMLCTGVLFVIVGMLAWAIHADRGADVGSKPRPAASGGAPAPTASLSVAAAG
jgi:hypothetical protein